MSLSENIKRLRLGKLLTQEQLAAMIGVSPQAVSKWETSEAYPDGSLLVLLSGSLGASLDELFDNPMNSMADISRRIVSLIHGAPEEKRFSLAREIGWQIERALFNCLMPEEEEYDPEGLENCRASSYISDDFGFTMISNGRAPFFSVFPETEHGFGETIGDGEKMRRVFECLSSPETVRAVIYLHRQESGFMFEAGVLIDECGIREDEIEKVMSDLEKLSVVGKKEIEINGEKCTLYISMPKHGIVALFLFANELNYPGYYTLQASMRKKPYLR